MAASAAKITDSKTGKPGQYDVGRRNGKCSICQEDLLPGTKVMAALRETNLGFERLDVSLECWAKVDREPLLAFWQTVVPTHEGRKKVFVDDAVLCELFEKLKDTAESSKLNFRFVLGLILMRKRMLVYESSRVQDGNELWTVRFRGKDQRLELLNPQLDEQQVTEVSQQLGEILNGRTVKPAMNLLHIRSLAGVTLICGFVSIGGCCPHPPPPAHTVYMGPTDSIDRVVQDINHNSGGIPTLWTQLNFNATLVDPEKHTSDNVDGDGKLLYSRPNSLRLIGSKDIAGEVFDLGSNDTEFWVKLRSGADTYNYWWGHYANLDKPGCQPIPIRPDLIIEVLGVGLYKTNFMEMPVPVMRFDNDADAYIFDFNYPDYSHWETLKEVWYDRASKLPIKVLLYGRDGRVVLKANLSQHKPVEIPGQPADKWPKVAGHFDLSFPDSGNQISFDLIDPAIQHKERIVYPNPKSFQRQEPDVGNTKVIQIDQACTAAAMGK